MHRGSLLPAMGGLPRRMPPSSTIALLVTPPPQIGQNGNASHPVSAGCGPKKPQGGSQGAAGGANHKCSRCKARPKSGSGSSLCIRCKLQREYCSPRGGFAGPCRKKLPMAALPMTPLSSSASSSSSPAIAGIPDPRGDGSHPATPQPTTPTSLQPAFVPAPNSPSGAGSPIGTLPIRPMSATLSPNAETAHFTNQPVAPKSLIVRLEVAGDVSRSLHWATLRDQQDLTETTWPQFMEELEGETDDFRPEPLNQIVLVSQPSPAELDQAELCPANVALPAEIMGAMGDNAGSAGAQLGLARLPPILSLPEAPESPSDFASEEPSGSSSPTTISPQSVNTTINAIGAANSEMSPPTQGVVVTLNIPDAEPPADISVEHCGNSPGQSATTSTANGPDCIISDRHEISPTASSPSQQIYLPMVSVATTVTSATMSTDTYSAGGPLHDQGDNCQKYLDAEVWRGHVRRSIRSYATYLEEAFSALLESPSETKWVTVLSVFQKKTVLSKILQRLSVLQRTLLPADEHASLQRVSRSAEQLFKAMTQLRGQMAAARSAGERLGQAASYPLSQTPHSYATPTVVREKNLNGCSPTMSILSSPSAIAPNASGDVLDSDACGVKSTASRPHLDVNSFMYPPRILQQQQQATPATTPPIANGTTKSPVYSASPATADVGESFLSNCAPSTSLPGHLMTSQKSLTEEADEEITKILAKLQKEDRCTTVPQGLLGSTDKLSHSTTTGLLSQQPQLNNPGTAYPFLTNGSTTAGQNVSKTEGLPAPPVAPSLSAAPQQQQQHSNSTESSLPAQLMVRLLSPEFPAQPEVFMSSADSQFGAHSSVTSSYGGTPINQTNESLDNGTYVNMAGRETDPAQRSFVQHQQVNVGAPIGNGQLYADDISGPPSLSQDSEHQSWETQQSQQVCLKSDNGDMFSPPPPKKPHVEMYRGGSVVPMVAAPQLRSLLARKLPAPISRQTTQSPCFMSDSYADGSGGAPHSLTTSSSPDVFQFSQHQRVYLSPSQGITPYHEAPKATKLLPTLPAFGSSLPQKALYQRGSDCSQYGSQSHDQQQQQQQQHGEHLEKMPTRLSPTVQVMGHQQMMNVGMGVGLQLSEQSRLIADSIPPNTNGPCSGLSEPDNNAVMHCAPLNRLDMFDTPTAGSLSGLSPVPAGPVYSSWSTVQCLAAPGQGPPPG